MIETRLIADDITVDAAAGVLEGYAVRYNSESRPIATRGGSFIETIAPGRLRPLDLRDRQRIASLEPSSARPPDRNDSGRFAHPGERLDWSPLPRRTRRDDTRPRRASTPCIGRP